MPKMKGHADYALVVEGPDEDLRAVLPDALANANPSLPWSSIVLVGFDKDGNRIERVYHAEETALVTVLGLLAGGQAAELAA